MITLKRKIEQLKIINNNIDSFIYEIKTEDVYEDFSKNRRMFDLSNFSVNVQIL